MPLADADDHLLIWGSGLVSGSDQAAELYAHVEFWSEAGTASPQELLNTAATKPLKAFVFWNEEEVSCLPQLVEVPAQMPKVMLVLQSQCLLISVYFWCHMSIHFMTQSDDLPSTKITAPLHECSVC